MNNLNVNCILTKNLHFDFQSMVRKKKLENHTQNNNNNILNLNIHRCAHNHCTQNEINRTTAIFVLISYRILYTLSALVFSCTIEFEI